MAVDEPIKVTRCDPNSPSGCRASGGRCLTHDLWDELGRQINMFLSTVSLDDVINRRVLGTAKIFPPAQDQQDANQPAAAAGE